APESIDRLLRIADHHEPARSEQLDDLGLNLIRVLKLVDEDGFKLLVIERLCVNGTREQITRPEKQIIEVEGIESALPRFESCRGSCHQAAQLTRGFDTGNLTDSWKRGIRIVSFLEGMLRFLCVE